MSDILPVYKKLKIDIDKAKGSYIWDKNGKKYTDFLSGISVTNLGHSNPLIIKAVDETLARYSHLSNLFTEENQEKLASELINKSMPGKVFFSNSGAEANECAIKAVRKYFNGEKSEIVSFTNSFHGRTLATLAATGQNKIKEGFGPIPEGFQHAEFNFLAAVEDKISYKTGAIMLEVIQGEGGVNIAGNDFLAGIKQLCNENDLLLIIDEIQTGIGRTGKFLGYQHYGIVPDIISLGKAVGGGFPLGATILSDKVAEALKPGDHGSTFGGNPISCAAGLATVNILDDSFLLDVSAKGDLLMAGLKDLVVKYNCIKEVRGVGLMVGMELNIKGAEIIDYLFDKGFIVNCTKEKVIRFLPPLTIEKHDIDDVIGVLDKYFEERE
jgi:predicted acetylornithine/succinylornithine family transaminase